jgi:WD40 repeat protein
VSKVVHDALRFAMWSGSGIQEAPLQVYYGALVFAPERSVVRHQFSREMPAGVQVKLGLDKDWGPLLQTLEGHTENVSSVAFSAAGDRLASASGDETVRVWDVKTGQPLQTLKCHTGGVNSLAFSAAGDRLASASRDQTVRVWDAKTGQPLHTFEDTDSTQSLAFSNDGSCLETNRGTLLLSLPAQSTSTLASQPPAQRIFVAERWLEVDVDEMVWIPANYLPSCTAVCRRQIAFGYSSGRVLVLELS